MQDGTFDVSPPTESGLLVPGDGKSLIVTDLNDDGWPDIIAAENNGPLHAFVHQQTRRSRAIEVTLHGGQGGPVVVGSRITLRLKDGRCQTAEVSAGGGYLSQSTPRLYFGVGPEDVIDKIEVRWPDQHRSIYPGPGDDETRLVLKRFVSGSAGANVVEGQSD